MAMHKSALVFVVCLLLVFSFYAEARVGGGYLEPVAVDDQEVTSLAKWATEKLHGTLIEILDAQRQVVAGWLYHLDIKMRNQKHQVKKCSVKVWIRHWLNSTKLVKARCRDSV